MNGLRHQLFARSTLSFNQNRGCVACGHLDLRIHLFDSLRSANDAVEFRQLTRFGLVSGTRFQPLQRTTGDRTDHRQKLDFSFCKMRFVRPAGQIYSALTGFRVHGNPCGDLLAFIIRRVKVDPFLSMGLNQLNPLRQLWR